MTSVTTSNDRLHLEGSSRDTFDACSCEAFLNAFTVDVEDYFQVSAFEREIDRSTWDASKHRVEENTIRMLDLLARNNTHATFFVLGWTARKFPKLVKRIEAAGHEIASHGFWHRLVYDQTPDEFRQDICDSRDLLADLVGKPIIAYRAPSFSITKKSLWALDILVEEGFRIDASIFPIRHDRYGIPDANPAIHAFEKADASLWEVPGATVRFSRVNVPVGGGGYLRLYPLWLTIRLLSKVNHKHRRPFIVYVHPWELDPGQPRIRTASRLAQFRHYHNLDRTEHRLETLMQRFRFGTVSEVLDSHG